MNCKSRRRARWKAMQNNSVLNNIDMVVTGFSFMFVLFIYGSIASAILFRRNEVDWSLVLPTFIILNVFMIVRWFFESYLHRWAMATCLKKRKAAISRVELNAKIRKLLVVEGKTWRYDNDGNLLY